MRVCVCVCVCVNVAHWYVWLKNISKSFSSGPHRKRKYIKNHCCVHALKATSGVKLFDTSPHTHTTTEASTVRAYSKSFELRQVGWWIKGVNRRLVYLESAWQRWAPRRSWQSRALRFLGPACRKMICIHVNILFWPCIHESDMYTCVYFMHTSERFCMHEKCSV